MQNNLQMLIEELQKQYDFLVSEIQQALDYEFYEEADWLSNALDNTRRMLYTLKDLKNPNASKIDALEQKLDFIKAKVKQQSRSIESTYLDSEFLKYTLPRLQKELEIRKSVKPKKWIDNDQLLTCLEEIEKGEIKSAVIRLENIQIFIQLLKVEQNLEIQIIPDEEDLFEYMRGEYVSELKLMGFNILNNKAILVIDQFENTKHLNIIEILSRVILDIFRSHQYPKSNKAKLSKQ